MDVSQLPPGNAPGLEWNSLQVGTVIAFSVTYGFCTLFLSLRYVQAVAIVKKVELDLFILSLAYLAALVYFVTTAALMRHGWGRHVDELNNTDFYQFNQILLPNTITYLITPAITKMAILVVLYQINPSTVYRCCVGAVGFAIFVYTLTLTTITGAPCNPLKEGTLTCLMNVALAQSILNIISDLAVIILPIPTILSLQLAARQKITVTLILALGSAVVICSIARLPYVKQMANDPDVTYTEAILGVWSIVEVNLGIICGSAMRLKPLLVRWFPQLGLFSSQGKSTGRASPFNSWGASKQLRTDPRNAEHTYQLHSVQKGSADPITDDSHIRVHREYDIRSENRKSGVTVKASDSDSDSVEKVNVPV